MSKIKKSIAGNYIVGMAFSAGDIMCDQGSRFSGIVEVEFIDSGAEPFASIGHKVEVINMKFDGEAIKFDQIPKELRYRLEKEFIELAEGDLMVYLGEPID